MAKSLMERFISKVDKSDDGCWYWRAYKNRGGYGVMRYGYKLGNKQATHVSIELFRPYDERPSIKHIVMHSCDNPPCVNPDHLKWGTDADNHRDKVAKGRQVKGSSHPFAKLTDEDVYNIRSLHSSGITQRKISSIFNISNQQISRIVNGKRWKKEGNENFNR